MDVANWLRQLGLPQYIDSFSENAVDWAVLPTLTPDDLKEIGVAAVGHRRRLLDAISAIPRGATAALPLAAALGPDAERRHLTVMFCDLADSTALSARLDPEDLRGVLGAYHSAAAEIIEGFEGFVAKYMGDGILAYFGYPRAHENDAERAVRAGLALSERISKLDIASGQLMIRVGIATGLVVVGDLIGTGEAQERSVVGETPNLAARLQSLAELNAVIVAAGTQRLVGDLFEYRNLGAIEVKGIGRPVQAWQVLRPSIIPSRFEALRGSALTPLIGREEEIEVLQKCWACAQTGNGQVVLISGEAGLGKSRITAALAEQLQIEPHIRLRYFCSPYHQDSALFPFADQIGRAAGFSREDAPPVRLEKLGELLRRAAPPEEDLALIADLLSLPSSEGHSASDLSSQRRKERTLEAMVRQLEGLARLGPVLMVFEDLHWVDPTSRELLDLIVERIPSLPVLLIMTFRPEFAPSWHSGAHVSTLSLDRFDRRERVALIEQLAGSKALPSEVIAQIVDSTDGVPLFVEELTKSVLESGLLREQEGRYVLDGALPAFAIPTSLHESLMARLDRLGSVRLVAQIGAAIGREFGYLLLHAVSKLPEDALQTSLDRLVASDLVFRRGIPPDAVYVFKHALVQDAAHGSLLRSTRQQLHARIAETSEVQSPELTNSQPEFFARHYDEAGLPEKSVVYWIKAGRRSAARSAMGEANAQFRKGLDQLGLLPDSRERQQHELVLRSALGMVLMSVKGYAASETGVVHARARQLWEELGSPSEFYHVPRGQCGYHIFCGEIDVALHLAEDLLHLSTRRNDLIGRIVGHEISGRILMIAGRFAESQQHLEAVLSLYDPILHQPLGHQIGTNPLVEATAVMANVCFFRGFPHQALTHSNSAVATARALSHPPSLAVSLTFATRLLSVHPNTELFTERAEQLYALAAEQGFSVWRAEATMYRGWAKVRNGDVTEGILHLRQGVTDYRAAGHESGLSHYLSLLGRAYAIGGRIEEGLALLEDALRIIERTGERRFAAELYRHKGRLLRREQPEKAEHLYRKALTTAEEQEAMLWRLRAAASLAQLWYDQGRRHEARELLEPVYHWFTEGFDTSDLQQAKTLLDALA